VLPRKRLRWVLREKIPNLEKVESLCLDSKFRPGKMDNISPEAAQKEWREIYRDSLASE